jgi:hypothetical protein
MTCKYVCKKCSFTSILKSDMKRHLTRKKKCIPDFIEKYEISDEQNLKESLIPIYNYNQEILDNCIECKKCGKFFVSDKNLNLHSINYCKNNLVESEVLNETLTQNINIEKIIIDNSIDNSISNITNNIINFNPILNIHLQDFKDDWKTNHISDIVKKVIFMCQHKFTNFLTEVLKNNENNNVVLDKNAVNGYVYNKSKMIFEVMSKDIIIDETFDKLKKQLLDLSDNAISEPFSLETSDIRKAVRDIKTKYSTYKTYNKKKKKIIDNLFTNIYDNNKSESAKNYSNIKNTIKLNTKKYSPEQY